MEFIRNIPEAVFFGWVREWISFSKEIPSRKLLSQLLQFHNRYPFFAFAIFAPAEGFDLGIGF